MTLEGFISLRKSLGVSQSELAGWLGMSLRAVQSIEGGESPLRTVHILSLERVALSIAATEHDPMRAPINVRREVVTVARDLGGIDDAVCASGA